MDIRMYIYMCMFSICNMGMSGLSYVHPEA